MIMHLEESWSPASITDPGLHSTKSSLSPKPFPVENRISPDRHKI